jgi:phosphoglycolate phosphatase-like HAD superfamily hydrolase
MASRSIRAFRRRSRRVRDAHSEGGAYDPEVFIEYTSASSKAWAARSRAVPRARDLYDAWAACHHFTLYEEVPEVLRDLHADGYTIGLISNTQRSLEAFERHFELDGLSTSRSPRSTTAS